MPSSPHAWDAARFSAVQRQQARLDRAFFRLVDELGRLEPASADEQRNEPEEDATGAQNEPSAPAANDDRAKTPNESDAVADVIASPAHLAAAAGPSPTPAPSGPLAERAAAERLLAEGRVKPVIDFLRAMLAGSDGPGGA